MSRPTSIPTANYMYGIIPGYSNGVEGKRRGSGGASAGNQ